MLNQFSGYAAHLCAVVQYCIGTVLLYTIQYTEQEKMGEEDPSIAGYQVLPLPSLLTGDIGRMWTPQLVAGRSTWRKCRLSGRPAGRKLEFSHSCRRLLLFRRLPAAAGDLSEGIEDHCRRSEASNRPPATSLDARAARCSNN